MKTNSLRALSATIFAALLQITAQADAACRNILVSEDAEFMVLDPATLATLRVGDLRWLGIRNAGIRAGSNFERALVSTSSFMRTNSDNPVIPGDPRYRMDGASVLLSLENMGENLRSQDDIPFLQMHPLDEPYQIQWADWIQENTLLREIYNRETHAVRGHELMDPGYSVQRQWRPRVGFDLRFPNCAVGDSVYFAGVRGTHRFDEQGGTILDVDWLRNEDFRWTFAHTKNCRILAVRETPREDPNYDAAVVDLIAESFGPEFQVGKLNTQVLFDGGARLLQQEYVLSPGRVTGPGESTNRFSLIDTTTAEVLLERELPIGSGALSPELLCDEETPVALVKDEEAFYLIDPRTLEIIAGKAVPELWRGVYFVTE